MRTLDIERSGLIDARSRLLPLDDWRAIGLSEPAKYSEVEALRDGRPVEIRALRPEDRVDFVAAVRRIGTDSLYRRFFAVKREFSEKETSFFVNVDFISHVALIAVVEEDGKSVIAGGRRYIVVNPGQAEVAFAVIDKYHGQRIGTTLMRHLVAIARIYFISQR